jgi:peroxiredoxin
MLRKFILFISITLLISTLNAQQSIPNITLKTVNGVKVQSNEFLNQDRFTIISFWATWCIPCINELDAINELYPSWKDKNIDVVAISTDDARSKKRVRPLVSGKNWVFEIYSDTNQEFKRALNVGGIPHTIITYGSKIIYRRIGYTPGEEEDLFKVIYNYKQ